MNQVLCHPSISWRPPRFVGSTRIWQSRDRDQQQQQSFMCSWHWSWPGMGRDSGEDCGQMCADAASGWAARAWGAGDRREAAAAAAEKLRLRRLPSWILLFYAVNTKYSRQPINPLQLWQVAIFNAGSRLRSSHECGAQSLSLSLSFTAYCLSLYLCLTPFSLSLPKCVGSEGPVRFELRLSLRLRLSAFRFPLGVKSNKTPACNQRDPK